MLAVLENHVRPPSIDLYIALLPSEVTNNVSPVSSQLIVDHFSVEAEVCCHEAPKSLDK